jgi:SAM-dependent methyltransferase
MKIEDIQFGRLYSELAWLMPLLTPPGEYAEEAQHWRTILCERLGPGRHRLLELGVGGGHNLSHLTAGFDAVAVDLSPAMLDLCRQLNPAVELHCGDMRAIRLERQFDAVLIHDAISYMTSEDDLRAAFDTAAAHLRPGGVFITSPDYIADEMRLPRTESRTHAEGATELTYFEFTYDPDPEDTCIETLMTYLIRTPDGLRIEHDRHLTGLFPRAAWLRLMAQAGFAVERRVFDLQSSGQPYELLIGAMGGER